MEHHEFSPSSLEKLGICPASYKYCKGLNEESNEFSELGSKLHDAMENSSVDGLSGEEMEQVTTAKEKEDQYINQIFGENNKNLKIHKEIKISVFGNNGKELTSGYTDKLVVDEVQKIALVIDYKFGFNKVNKGALQLEVYGTGAYQSFDVETVFCSIIQPSIFNFQLWELEKPSKIIDRVENIIKNCKSEKAWFKQDEKACRYCKFKIYCPETKKTELMLSDSKIATQEMHTDKLISLIDQYKAIKKIGGSLEAEFYKRVSLGVVEGYELKTGKKSRSFNDINKVFELASTYLTSEEIIKYANISVAQLEKDIADKIVAQEGCTKVSAKKQFTEEFSSVIDESFGKKTISKLTKVK